MAVQGRFLSGLSDMFSSGLGDMFSGGGSQQPKGGYGEARQPIDYGKMFGGGGGLLNQDTEGLFGQDPNAQSYNYGAFGMNDRNKMQLPSVPYSRHEGQGLLSRGFDAAQDYGSRAYEGAKDFGSNVASGNYNDLLKTGLLGIKTYGDYQTGKAAQENAQSEIDYRNRIAALQEAEAASKTANKEATNQAILDAFDQSALSKRKREKYYTA